MLLKSFTLSTGLVLSAMTQLNAGAKMQQKKQGLRKM